MGLNVTTRSNRVAAHYEDNAVPNQNIGDLSQKISLSDTYSCVAADVCAASAVHLRIGTGSVRNSPVVIYSSIIMASI